MLLTSILLSRLLGVTGYGMYVNAMAWANLICVMATLGFPRLLVRETAACYVKGSWGLFRGMVRFSGFLVLVSSIIFAAGAALVGWILFRTESNSAMLQTLWIALSMVPLLAFIQLQQASICGFRRVVLGQLPALLIRPVLFLLLACGAYLMFGGAAATAPKALLLQLGTTVITFALTYTLFRMVSGTTSNSVAAEYTPRVWLSSAFPFFLLAGMSVFMNKCGIIMLGAMGGAEMAAIFRVASRGAELVLLPFFALSSPFQPLIVELHASGKRELLQRIVTKGVRIAFLMSLFVALLFAGFGSKFLLLFGSEFVLGQTALVVLVFAQLVNVGSGMVGMLLNMSGHEKDSVVGACIGALLNVILNLIFIPKWGINGAAIATCCSVVLCNLFLVIRVYERMSIHSTILGKIGTTS